MTPRGKKPKTVRAVLLAAAKLIEKGWCRGWCAVDARGKCVYPCDPNAARWCAIGAIARACNDQWDMVDKAARHLGNVVNCPVSVWNDKPARRGKQVAAALRRAAESVGRE